MMRFVALTKLVLQLLPKSMLCILGQLIRSEFVLILANFAISSWLVGYLGSSDDLYIRHICVAVQPVASESHLYKCGHSSPN